MSYRVLRQLHVLVLDSETSSSFYQCTFASETFTKNVHHESRRIKDVR